MPTVLIDLKTWKGGGSQYVGHGFKTKAQLAAAKLSDRQIIQACESEIKENLQLLIKAGGSIELDEEEMSTFKQQARIKPHNFVRSKK